MDILISCLNKLQSCIGYSHSNCTSYTYYGCYSCNGYTNDKHSSCTSYSSYTHSSCTSCTRLSYTGCTSNTLCSSLSWISYTDNEIWFKMVDNWLKNMMGWSIWQKMIMIDRFEIRMIEFRIWRFFFNFNLEWEKHQWRRKAKKKIDKENDDCWWRICRLRKRIDKYKK